MPLYFLPQALIIAFPSSVFSDGLDELVIRSAHRRLGTWLLHGVAVSNLSLISRRAEALYDYLDGWKAVH